MTVKELIEVLQTMPQDIECRGAWEGITCPVQFVYLDNRFPAVLLYVDQP